MSAAYGQTVARVSQGAMVCTDEASLDEAARTGRPTPEMIEKGTCFASPDSSVVQIVSPMGGVKDPGDVEFQVPSGAGDFNTAWVKSSSLNP